MQARTSASTGLCPGSTWTAQTEARLENAADPETVLAPLVVHQALKRLADPNESTVQPVTFSRKGWQNYARPVVQNRNSDQVDQDVRQ
jgi:hypothetical protein